MDRFNRLFKLEYFKVKLGDNPNYAGKLDLKWNALLMADFKNNKGEVSCHRLT